MVRCSTVVDGVIDSAVLEVVVQRAPVPALREGDVLVMDNLSIHKRTRGRSSR